MVRFFCVVCVRLANRCKDRLQGRPRNVFSLLVGIVDIQVFPDAATGVLSLDDLHRKGDVLTRPRLRIFEVAVRDDGGVIARREWFKAAAAFEFIV